MPSLSLNFEFATQEIADQAIAELADHFGYPERVLGPVEITLEDGSTTTQEQSIPNPQNKVDFCKRKVADMLGDIIRPRIVAKVTAGAAAQIHAALAATGIS